MSLLKFGKEQKIGIKLFDDQHKQIIDTANHLFKIKDHKKEEILEYFSSLISQMKTHFESEEAFMKEKKIVQYISHKLEHDRALNKYSDYLQTLKFDRKEFDPEILDSLANWISTHIEKKDSKLKSQINKN